MLKLSHTKQLSLFLIPVASLLASSQNATAQIYKWQDERGITQYSDKKPTVKSTKATPAEVVNSLQAKDLCTVPKVATKSKAANIAVNDLFDSEFLNANFFMGGSSTPKVNSNTVTSSTTISTTVAAKNPSNTTTSTATTASSTASTTVAAISSSTTGTSTTTSWTKCANQFQSCQFQGATKTVRYGGNGKYFSGTFTNYVGCSDSAFNGDPAPNVAKICEVKSTGTTVAQSGTSSSSGSTTNSGSSGSTSGSGSTTTGSSGSTSGSSSGTLSTIIQKELMPAVNTALNMTPAAGTKYASSKLLIYPTSEQPSTYEFSDGGAVRIDCNASHMGNNDPIVFPNQAGAAHHHTFFGNTSVNEKTTHASLLTASSTCSGGSMNRSAYWVPSMINTKTNAPIAPVNNIAYYKTSKSAEVTVPPEGLRMIAGNQKATTPFSGNQANWRFTCNQDYQTHADHIPNCANGSTMEYMIIFPECWNGNDLDSPNHQDHMAYPTASGSCPTTHPVRIPQIAFTIHYQVNDPNGTQYWRLASDNYSTDKPGGYSAHGDWMEGWDRTMIKRLVDGCLKAHKDCHAHLTGDGYMFDKPEFHP